MAILPAMSNPERMLLLQHLMQLADEDLHFTALVACATVASRQGGNVIHMEGTDISLIAGMAEAHESLEALWVAYQGEILGGEDTFD